MTQKKTDAIANFHNSGARSTEIDSNTDVNVVRMDTILRVALLIVLLAGALYSYYLTELINSPAPENAPCSTAAAFDCAKNIHSEYGTLLGIPISAFGMGLFVFLFGHSLMEMLMNGVNGGPLRRQNRNANSAFALPYVMGCLAGSCSIYLLYISVFILHSICYRCLGFYGIVALTILMSRAGLKEEFGGQPVLWLELLWNANTRRSGLALAFAALCFVIVALTPLPIQPSRSPTLIDNSRAMIGNEKALGEFELVRGTKPVIKVVEFADFECEACKVAGREIQKIQSEFPGRIDIQYVNFPLCNECNPEIPGALHPNACLAAKIGIVLRHRGKFDGYCDKVFENTMELNERRLAGITAALNEPWGEVRTIADSAWILQELQSDIALARKARIKATPTFTIDGTKIVGSQALVHLRDMLNDGLQVAESVRPAPAFPALAKLAGAGVMSRSSSSLQTVTATYQGLSGEATGTCSVQYNIWGQAPSGPGPYPVHIHVVGTNENYMSGEAQTVVGQMAARGFVAVSIDYPHKSEDGCTALKNKMTCMFDSSSPNNALAAICGLPGANCNLGITMSGISQGSNIATMAKNYEPRVQAVYGMADGDKLTLTNSTIDMTSCMDPANRALPVDRLRAIDGDADQLFGQTVNGVGTELNAITGQNCDPTNVSCLRPNGSGWYMVLDSEVQNPPAQHVYITDPGWNPPNIYSWSLIPNLEWLAGFIYNTNPPVINAFTADFPTQVTGHPVTLTWNTSGATGISINPGNATSVNSSGALTVTPTQTTNYVLTATNDTGMSTTSFTVTVTATDVTSPSTPKSLAAASVSSSQINLSWNPSTDNVGVAGYSILRCSGNGCTPVAAVATSSTNTFTDLGLSATTSYTYSVSAYDAAGNYSPVSATATVVTQTPPTITAQPANQSVSVGQTATFNITASGGAPLSYQWQRNGATIAGAISTSYTTPAATMADNGSVFQCVVSNTAGSASSNAATLRVINGTPVITSAAFATPNPAAIGQSVRLTAAASDADGDMLTYSWTFGDGATATGATATHAYVADGNYTAMVLVSDPAGATASSSLTVTINTAVSTLHVAGLAMTLTSVKRGKTATAQVTITDSAGAPISGATVSGQWSGLVTGSVSGSTGTGGTIAFTSSKSSSTGTFTFTITNVSATGYAYASSQNAATSGSIDTSGHVTVGAALGDPSGAQLLDSVRANMRFNLALPLPPTMPQHGPVRAKATGLPAGVRVRGGFIAGKPTKPGTFPFTVNFQARVISVGANSKKTVTSIQVSKQYLLTVLP